MQGIDLDKLLKRKMDRREFLRYSGVFFLSIFGIAGVIRELQSHAATFATSSEAESGTLGGNAQTITDSNASGGGAVTFGGGSSGTTYITGLSNTGNGNLNWFVDQNGTPRFLIYDNPWALIPNAGRYNGSGGGTWQEDIDNYCSARGRQGFTATYLDPFAAADHNVLKPGMTWDNVPPFNNGTSTKPGTPDSGLNDTYWQRVDRFVDDCAAAGMTAIMDIAYTEGNTGDIDNWESGFTQAQFTAMGSAIAARYKNKPNIMWTMGNDYNYAGAPENNSDFNMSYLYTGLRNGGDTHVLAYHPLPESDSKKDFQTGSVGQPTDAYLTTITQFSMMYTYIQNYFGMEYAYGTENSQIPIVWGDGYFYSGNDPQYDMFMRQCFWWSVASGARGCMSGSEEIWQWTSSSPGAVTGRAWYDTQAGVAVSLIESLPNWYKLVPDTSNQLVTAGRGTRRASDDGTSYDAPSTSDNYIAASFVADGSLALIYFSPGCHANTITINQGKMQAGYTATWVDPTNGHKYSATPGTTYSAGSARGNNAAGYADWVLVLQGP